MKALTISFMEDVFHSLDLEHLNKLAKVLPQKLSSSIIIPKNISYSFKNRLFNQFLKEKNLIYIFKYISKGHFHDIVANDENVYKNISIHSMDVFFEEIKNKELESPFSFYIYLLEQTDESKIVDFFQNVDGLKTFKNDSLIYIKNKEKKQVSTDISLEYKKMEDLLNLYKKDIICTKNKEKASLREIANLKKKIEKNNNDKLKELNKLEKKLLNEKECEINFYKKEVTNILLKLKNSESKYLNLEKKFSILNSTLKNKEQEIVELKKIYNSLTNTNQSTKKFSYLPKENKKMILLIGVPGKIIIREDYDFIITNPDTSLKDIIKIIEENDIIELWITTFQLIPRIKKNITQSLKNKIKIRELNDFTMLMKEENINGSKTR
ncbi:MULTISPECIES: synaptonemal complex protein 1 [Enterococcus]|uniref:Uncharacterized protein n=11 Tax=Bacilli TaxID=91061 RepID=A0A640MH70_BACAN|nr:hypothetical protein [Enterococcus faecalis]GEU13303.1 hypothetical protein QuyetLC_24010 [Bacillus anthracis]MBV6952778.1 hypothetical protein [Enterococcus faecalis]MCD4979124.1 hypothetical protein [Enterococcus faecalis]MCP9741570.1 hypothetical protein [Enterococcus faecalis]MCU2237108.1 hypothetical protein [Enterococcus faecalis]